MAESNWWKDRVTELSTRMGAGLLGKAAPVLGLGIIFTIVAMIYLPNESKLLALYAFFGVFAVSAVTILAIILLHPILGNMDGPDALKYLKADYAAKNPRVIQGTSRPVANNAAAAIETGKSQEAQR